MTSKSIIHYVSSMRIMGLAHGWGDGAQDSRIANRSIHTKALMMSCLGPRLLEWGNCLKEANPQAETWIPFVQASRA